jgi:hypothetical protein
LRRFYFSLENLQRVERQPLPGYSFFGLVPLPANGSRLALCAIGATAGNPPKAPPRGSNAATGWRGGQNHERGSWWLLWPPRPLCDSPGSVRHQQQWESSKPVLGLVGRSFPQAPTLHHPAAGGTSPRLPFSLNFFNLVGQANGGQLAVHGGRVSVGEGWATIAPVGPSTPSWCGRDGCPGRALLQALGARRAFLVGVRGRWRPWARRQPRTGPTPGLVPYKTTRTACTMSP